MINASDNVVDPYALLAEPRLHFFQRDEAGFDQKVVILTQTHECLQQIANGLCAILRGNGAAELTS